MMRVDIFTLFPGWFDWFSGQRHITNAIDAGSLEVRLFNYRDFTSLKHGQIDDTPAGGGAGMVLRVDAVCEALEAVYEMKCESVRAERPVFVLSPRGLRLKEPLIKSLSELNDFTLLCGRYEGIDERVIEHLSSGEISIGDFVVSGGELPAMVLVDALARKIPGALGSEESAVTESFSDEFNGRLEYPQYTKPAEFKGWKVPDILLSGNHAEIEKWRREHLR